MSTRTVLVAVLFLVFLAGLSFVRSERRLDDTGAAVWLAGGFLVIGSAWIAVRVLRSRRDG